jgi:hypothetical protein
MINCQKSRPCYDTMEIQKYSFNTYIYHILCNVQNLHGVILARSQLPISARRAKNAYQYQHTLQKMHINDVTMKKYVTINKSIY